VGELTDQMQLLKLETENLRNEILDKNLMIESLHKEIEAQKVGRGQLVQQHAQKQNEIRAEIEVKFSNQIWDLKMKNESIAAQLLESSNRCAEAETKVERLERELSQIRGHMMGILQGTNEAAGASAKRHASAAPAAATSNDSEAANDPVISSASGAAYSAKEKSRSSIETLTIQSVSDAAATESNEPSVNDYLKRLGY
jgi:chromosome segregation ATPase